ncbi:protein of unknown function [Mucilaginibacter lappiensis]|uniref:Uncharacterized protein (DUF885 family) n=1 Tax=Mucilaginibacter lappiensis TaxID=354630 RepID=A0ABR6PQE9_9SPHI|nr:DUF885 domain-containing protein [Mucilaginibacter lappiensis]MBB6110491.1 uncharacterized protein (DUF885 family) [Mucilaginibacter lappiensis]SIR39050.1 protein of unknown function [Mucilaginibacter lappiensis]
MKTFIATISLCILSLFHINKQQNFDAFCSKFVSGYKALNLPELDLSYVTGLEHIGSAEALQKQLVFFKSVRAELGNYSPAELNPSQKTDYALIDYESELNLERLVLEQDWLKQKPAQIPAGGIINIPNGKAWYAYLLKRWVNADVTPDQIYQFGLTEVSRVQKHIEAIRAQTGLSEDAFYKHLNDSSFFEKDPAKVQQAFEHTKAIVYTNLPKLFNNTNIRPLKIEKGAAKQLAQTPGYYDNDTFYYNLFDKPYNKRQVDWLFIHEAVPGHHYQSSIVGQTKTSAVQQLFFYMGFAEGWAAYIEELGKQLGVYQTPYDELGKWEWDMVRSVRVPLDVGLNYYGWTDAQALAFWKKNIRNQDDIAQREIARIRRWPAQVVTYKYGALQILHWKEELQKKQGKNFNIKDFHSRVLDHGSLPLFLVKENVFR